jgi:hypothetical protein
VCVCVCVCVCVDVISDHENAHKERIPVTPSFRHSILGQRMSKNKRAYIHSYIRADTCICINTYARVCTHRYLHTDKCYAYAAHVP